MMSSRDFNSSSRSTVTRTGHPNMISEVNTLVGGFGGRAQSRYRERLPSSLFADDFRQAVGVGCSEAFEDGRLASG